MDNQKFPNIFKKSKVDSGLIILILIAILIVGGLFTYEYWSEKKGIPSFERERIKVEIGTTEKEMWGAMGK